MRTALFVLTFLAAIVAGGVLVIGFSISTGAPQEAAFAGLAMAIVAIPYCGARSYQIASDERVAKRRHAEIVRELESLRKALEAQAPPKPPAAIPSYGARHQVT